MGNVEYDVERLKASDEIDVDGSLEKFDSRQEYFDGLTAFSKESTKYLVKYSPYKISFRDDVRKDFLRELKALRETFTALGMIEALSDLKYLESSAFSKDSAALQGELSEFYDRMKKLTDIIVSARILEQKEAEQQDTAAPVKHTVLAVDDMPALLSSLLKMLHEEYEVIAVTSGQSALKVLEKHTPSLFILDIEMPRMNGYELAAIIRTYDKFKTTPIIFLTARNGREDVISAVKHGGNDYIVKPVDKELLLSKISRFLT